MQKEAFYQNEPGIKGHNETLEAINTEFQVNKPTKGNSYPFKQGNYPSKNGYRSYKKYSDLNQYVPKKSKKPYPDCTGIEKSWVESSIESQSSSDEYFESGKAILTGLDEEEAKGEKPISSSNGDKTFVLKGKISFQKSIEKISITEIYKKHSKIFCHPMFGNKDGLALLGQFILPAKKKEIKTESIKRIQFKITCKECSTKQSAYLVLSKGEKEVAVNVSCANERCFSLLIFEMSDLYIVKSS